MSTRHIEPISAIASTGRKSQLLRFGLGALLWVASFGGTTFAPTADAGVMAPMATLAPAQPDSGTITVDQGKDVTLTVVKKIGDQGIAGQKIEWTVSGAGSASLKPNSSTTSARSDTSDAGLASTVFNATTAGDYKVTATTQKNPGCETPSCATWVSTRFSVTVAAAGTADSSSGSGGLTRNEALGLAAVAGAGALVAASDNNNGNNNQPALSQSLASAGGNGQEAAANAPLAQPLQVLAQNNGANAASIAIQWSASGGAILSSSETFTNTSGIAAVQVLNVGPGPGPVTVTATRTDDSGASTSFTINILQPALAIKSGNGQSGVVGQPLAQPLVVEAEQSNSPQANLPIVWVVSSGNAVVTSVSNGGKTNAQGLSQASITLGSNPGPVTVTATRNDGSGVTQTFGLTATPLPKMLLIESGDNQKSFTSAPVPKPLVVRAELGTTPQANIPIVWAVASGSAKVTSVSNGGKTDSAGDSSAVISFLATPGPVTITATRNDGSVVSQTFNLTSYTTNSLALVSVNPQTVGPGKPVPPLVVKAITNNLAASGVTINWSANNGATPVSGTSKTGANGQASFTVTNSGLTPGPTTLTATRQDDPTDSVQFTINILPASLAATGGNNQKGYIGTNAVQLLQVLLKDGNGNTVTSAQTVQWTVTPSSSATLSSYSSTTVNGVASTNLTFGVNGGGFTVTASAYGGTATATLGETAIVPGTITSSGTGQSGAPNHQLTQPLIVQIPPLAGSNLQGVPVTFAVQTGFAQLSNPATTTDPTGKASTTLTLGPTPESVQVQAQVGGGGPLATFNETATGTSTSLTQVSGSSPALKPGVPQTLEVRLKGNGLPISGQTITWTTTGGTLSGSSSGPTDASGDTQIQVTPSGFGSFIVTASFAGTTQYGASQIVFSEGTGNGVPAVLKPVSGGGQVIAPNKPSNALVVQLLGSGAPLAGQPITWTTTNGSTLSASTTTTDSTGSTHVTVTPTTSGPIQVTATFYGYHQFTSAQAGFSENTTLATVPTLSTNGQSVGTALDSACSQLQATTSRTPQQQDLLNQCLALNTSSAVSSGTTASVVAQLTPTVAETQTQTATTANTAQFNNLSDRMIALRSGAQGASLAGLSFIGPNGSLPIFDLGSTLLGATSDASKKDSSGGFSRWGFFMSGQIGRQEASAQSLTPAYNLDISGLTAGADYRVNDGWVLGGALGYSRQTTDLVGGGGNLSMNGWSLSGYATWYNKSDWYVDSSLTWSNNNFDSHRNIDYSLPLPDGSVETVDQVAQASSGGDTFAGSMTFGRDFHKQALAYGFYGKLQYSHQAFDGYQEQLNQSEPGSGLGLRVDERTDTSLDSVLGAKFDYPHSTNWGVLIPHAEIEWQHEFRPDPSNFQAFFIDDPTNTPILIKGNAIDDNYFRIGVGLSLVLKQGRSAFLLYDHTVGEQGVTAYNVSLGFRMEF